MEYNKIRNLEYVGNCTNDTISRLATSVVNKGKLANKLHINKIIKRYHPSFYNDLALAYYNPYRYYYYKNMLVIVHSGMEYLFKVIYYEGVHA
jgi:hypothetical protein